MKIKKITFFWICVIFSPLLFLGYIWQVHEEEKETYQTEEAFEENVKKLPLNSLKIEDSDHVLGDKDSAQVILFEYSDTECPYCKSFHYKFRDQIFNKYPGRIAWVYRHYPLVIYPKSLKEAEALECAVAQKGNDIFWKYLEEIYLITPSKNGLDPAQLLRIAENFDLNVQDFRVCLEESRFAKLVADQRFEGVKLGIEEAPSVIVWNKFTNEKFLVNGANSRFQEIKLRIENALGNKR